MRKKCLGLTAALLFSFIVACTIAGCSARTYKITIASGQDLVKECPEEAVQGDTVKIDPFFVTDADLYVSVDGDKDFGAFTKGGVYEFVM